MAAQAFPHLRLLSEQAPAVRAYYRVALAARQAADALPGDPAVQRAALALNDHAAAGCPATQEAAGLVVCTAAVAEVQ